MPSRKSPITLPSEDEMRAADELVPSIRAIGELKKVLPADVQKSLEWFEQVGTVSERIRDEQPKVLEPYADAFLRFFAASSGLPEEQVADLVVMLFSSTQMAHLIADVAAGVVEPVATSAKSTKGRSRKSTARTKAKAPADQPEESDSPDEQTGAEPVADPHVDLAAEPEPDTVEDAVADAVAPGAGEAPTDLPEPQSVEAPAGDVDDIDDF